MASDIDTQLDKALADAHALEKQATRMLQTAKQVTKDSEVASIFRAHLLQTEEHERYISERLAARGKGPSKLKDIAAQAGALGLGGLVAAAPRHPGEAGVGGVRVREPRGRPLPDPAEPRRARRRSRDRRRRRTDPRAGGGGGRARRRHLRPGAREHARRGGEEPAAPGGADRQALGARGRPEGGSPRAPAGARGRS